MASAFKTVFISYSTHDREIAYRVCQVLESFGVNCWIAPRDIKPGTRYDDAIVQGIESTFAFILLLSENANASVSVKSELELAKASLHTVYPIRIQQVEPTGGIRLFLAGTQWVDAWVPPLEAHLKEIVPLLLSQRNRETCRPVAENRIYPPLIKPNEPCSVGFTYTYGKEVKPFSAHLLNIRNSPICGHDLFGACVLASCGIALPLVCKSVLSDVQNALPFLEMPRQNRMKALFAVSTLGLSLGVLALLFLSVCLLLKPRNIEDTVFLSVFIPCLSLVWLGFGGFLCWLYMTANMMLPLLAQRAESQNLPDAELRSTRLPLRLVKSLYACTIAHLAALITVLICMREYLMLILSPIPFPAQLTFYLTAMMLTLGGLFLAVTDTVKDVLVEIVWPKDSRFTFLDFFRDEDKRSHFHWHNIHTSWLGIYFCFVFFVVTCLTWMLGY